MHQSMILSQPRVPMHNVAGQCKHTVCSDTHVTNKVQCQGWRPLVSPHHALASRLLLLLSSPHSSCHSVALHILPCLTAVRHTHASLPAQTLDKQQQHWTELSGQGVLRGFFKSHQATCVTWQAAQSGWQHTGQRSSPAHLLFSSGGHRSEGHSCRTWKKGWTKEKVSQECHSVCCLQPASTVTCNCELSWRAV